MGTQSEQVMAPTLTPVEYDLVYNMISLGLASMAASTIFFYLRLSSFAERYKTALCITGLVTFIAADGEVNIHKCDADKYGYRPTGIPFNDAYRYVDWLLTVPLLLIEIVLVMRLDKAETYKRCTTLGICSALMIAFGYPGETSGVPGTRWVFWFISMIPFTYIVYTLFFGLKESQNSQPECARDLVKYACYATVISWCTYPVVYIFPMLSGSTDGKAGLSASAMVSVQVGYTISDIISKCGVGFPVYRIGLAKSEMERGPKYERTDAEDVALAEPGV